MEMFCQVFAPSILSLVKENLMNRKCLLQDLEKSYVLFFVIRDPEICRF